MPRGEVGLGKLCRLGRGVDGHCCMLCTNSCRNTVGLSVSYGVVGFITGSTTSFGRIETNSVSAIALHMPPQVLQCPIKGFVGSCGVAGHKASARQVK